MSFLVDNVHDTISCNSPVHPPDSSVGYRDRSPGPMILGFFILCTFSPMAFLNRGTLSSRSVAIERLYILSVYDGTADENIMNYDWVAFNWAFELESRRLSWGCFYMAGLEDNVCRKLGRG